MINQENDKLEAKELRQNAEAELKTRKSIGIIPETDHLRLIHELQVHQIELEMQNEELIKAREQAESAMEKYTDLYDFAPSGYLTLSEDGNITDLNFLAAKKLGNDRAYLKNTRFGLHVAPESLELFNDFFDRLFRYRRKETCELLLQSKHQKPIYVHVAGHVSQNTDSCLVTMFDITERKAMELELQKSVDKYKTLNDYFIERELRMIDLKKDINELLIKSGCEKEYLI
jgi:PAS domain S-box-containing protein